MNSYKNLLKDDNLFKIFYEGDFSSLGIGDDILTGLRKDPYQSHKESTGFLGMMILNYLYRNNVWNGKEAKKVYLPIVSVADVLGLNLSDFVKIKEGNRNLAIKKKVDGIDDLCISIADIHLVNNRGDNQDHRLLAAEYSKTGNILLIPGIVKGMERMVYLFAKIKWERLNPGLRQLGIIKIEDLIDYGYEGLMMAVKNFDTEEAQRRGAQFQTYAGSCIKSKMNSCITEKVGDLMKVTQKISELYRNLVKFKNLFYTENGRNPDPDEYKSYWDKGGLSKEFPEKLLDYFVIHNKLPIQLSLDMDYAGGQEHKEDTLLNVFGDDKETDPYQATRINQLRTTFKSEVDRLPISQDRKNLFYRMIDEKLTLEQAGQLCGVTRERVRQVIAKYFTDPLYFRKTRELLGFEDQEIKLNL